ncbi:ubiquinol-cytochrome c reductase iron-sulfur subunit [Hydrogenimonas cancrithermarum]|uniref:Ubiquinol-cytochrome c reductase iron-sulfur subunit n=1 Tax=Hydrogenimonas cancrithermarum TaxID=2993563 RepID=A0ABM8FM28_9BACT|nr:ubiquinol-cytochrome c reductase iron-sulfur subunit [Hydrogenimonas cancrithermarum]BDY12786.1 ubiquinol-cytochrome c reductase iron-sulfur subunit [Hydrogenimonas cancrithermarum]
MADSSRRDFMGKVFGGWAALGGLGALYAAKKTWDPLPSVKAAGFTKVDLSAAEPNVLNVEKWRGKPIFILKKTPEMVAKQSEEETARDVVVGKDHFLVCIGLCTHLGCIPAYRPDRHDFKCACHGGEFDVSGINTLPPPPSPMVIPPFKIEGTTIVLGEEGPEYKKMKEAGVIA